MPDPLTLSMVTVNLLERQDVTAPASITTITQTTGSSSSSLTTRTTTVSGTTTAVVDDPLVTSKIVRTAVAAGVIVLALTGVVLFFKISSWIRYNQRLRRQHSLNTLLQREQRANAYEIAAWADEPGLAPVKGEASGPGKGRKKKKVKEGLRTQKRGGANAHAVYEWEGVAQ